MESLYKYANSLILQGNDKLTCSGDGQWLGSLPSCVPKPCNYLVTPLNSLIKFVSKDGYDQGYGSEAHIECAVGDASNAPSILTCSQSGDWIGTIHQCNPVCLKM